MALYTRKNGSYVKLTKDQLWKMRRMDDVIRLQNSALRAGATMAALVGWLTALDSRSKKVSVSDLAVSRLPNRLRIAEQVNDMKDKVAILRGVK